jgi:hypothetical protein
MMLGYGTDPFRPTLNHVRREAAISSADEGNSYAEMASFLLAKLEAKK